MDWTALKWQITLWKHGVLDAERRGDFLLDYRERVYKCEYTVSRGRWGSQRRCCICWCFRRELCLRPAVHTLRPPHPGAGWHCWRRSRSSDLHLERLHWPSPKIETKKKDADRLQRWKETRKYSRKKEENWCNELLTVNVFCYIFSWAFSAFIIDSEEMWEREIYKKCPWPNLNRGHCDS